MRSLVGDWLVEATVPGGGAYTGSVAVRAAGPTVEVAWDTTAGRYFGIGLEQGGAWYVACGEDGPGLGLGLLGRDGGFRWTPAPSRGAVGVAALVAAPAPPGALAWVPGSPAVGGLPFTRISLTGGGEVVEAELTGGSAPRGLGLPTAAGWAIAWYPVFGQTVILCYRPDEEAGTWRAVWALGGRPGTAWEVLRAAG